MSDLHDAARIWAARGFAVFPCLPSQKEPANKHGCKEASSDLDAVDAWWSASPNANIGGATGKPSGCWVLDIDGPTGEQTLARLVAEHGPLPETLITSTGGGGRHLFFSMPDGIDVRNSTSKVGPKLDVRGTGGYVILPPSLHPGGGEYTLLRNVPYAAAPAWLLALATASKGKTPPGPALPLQGAPQGRQDEDDVSRLMGSGGGAGGSDAARLAGIVAAACDRIRSAPEGTRNDTLNTECFSIGGWLDGLGGTVEAVAPDLEAAARGAEQDPATVRRALEAGRKQPRGRPPDTQLSEPAAADWFERAKDALEGGDVGELLSDPAVLQGAARPGAKVGEWEALLLSIPSQQRAAIRKAVKATLQEARKTRLSARVATTPVLVVHGRTWWVLDASDDRYLAVERELVAIEIARLHKIDTTVPTEAGSRWMTAAEVYNSHGVTARSLVWTYGREASLWDEDTRTLHVAAARVLEGDAEPNPQVAEWLARLVLPEQHAKLLDWLATCTQLDKCTASPQFRGASGAGKGMLLSALTTLLGGRTEYKHATGDYNGELITSPLVVLDEGTQESRPDEFRSLTGNREHKVISKGRMSETLIGCPRVVVFSNDPDPLKLGRETLSVHGEEALGGRILDFDVPRAAAEYLADIGGFAATDGWADANGALVKHIRWLTQTRAVVPGDRFLVSGDAQEWIAKAHLREGVSNLILQAFAVYNDLVEDGRTGELGENQPFYFLDGEASVGVCIAGLQAHWITLIGDRRVPSYRSLSRALQRMSGQDGPTRLRLNNDARPRVYSVSSRILALECK